MADIETHVNVFMRGLKRRNPYEVEFHQAVEEVATDIMPWYLECSNFRKAQILERLSEPDRVVSFGVPWQKDNGEVRINRGWRVQFNNSLGPYKGGLRFHPSVNQSILKFLGFEQIFKNSLTGLPMGGAKGGSNFDPKGRSDDEVMRFCQSFMTQLYRYIGEDQDVPAGDIGVGAREISYLFGQYKRIENRWAGVLTGKGVAFGGSAVRKEATGYGCIYFCEHMVIQKGDELKNKTAAISGSGNVALYTAQKAMQRGVKVLTMSDSGGYIYCKKGLSEEQLQELIELKEKKRGRISSMADNHADIDFCKDEKPWGVDCDIALPCATQNDIDLEEAKALANNGVQVICEGANMPVTAEATTYFREKKILHAPGKASNAGGVAVSGLEQTQNALRMGWSKEKVDEELQSIMENIHKKCVEEGKTGDYVDYVKGANIAGFKKVAQTLFSYGVV